jgi:hypothetical protein
VPHAPLAPDWEGHGDIGPDHGQARASDLPTAKAAAAQVKPGGARYALLIAHLSDLEGMTDEEAAIRAGLSLTSEYATRCSELARAGYLHDTTLTRVGRSGVRRVVRSITDLGIDLMKAHGYEPVAPSKFVCQGCGKVSELKDMYSKWGKPQVVGWMLNRDGVEKRLMEAKCITCETKPRKGLQAIWREQ